MNVLLVDDQPNILSSLLANIRWSDMGVTNVDCASSALEAREMITHHSVDVLLTDIEMPVENGMMLLQWAREQGYDFECVFLTSHADFHYIRRAMNLEACDYVLQPARFEDIQAAVEKAVERRKLSLSRSEYMRLGRYAFESRNDAMGEIWTEWLQGKAGDLPRRLRELKRYGISLAEETPVSLSFLVITSWQEPPRLLPTLLDDVGKKLSAIFSYLNQEVLPFCLDDRGIYLLLYPRQPAKDLPDLQAWNRYFQRGAQEITSAYAFSFTWLVAQPLPVQDLPSAYAGLSRAADGLMRFEDDFFFGADQPSDDQPFHIRFLDAQSPQGFHSTRGAKESVYDLVVQYIRSHLNEPVTCADIASSLYLSPDYVTRIIREREGKTLKKLLMELKMEEAKRLLDTTDMPIGEIALQLGFSSASHFSSAYRAAYHQSPRDHRK